MTNSPDVLYWVLVFGLSVVGGIIISLSALLRQRQRLWETSVHEAGHALYVLNHERQLGQRFDYAKVVADETERSLVHSTSDPPDAPEPEDASAKRASEFYWHHGVCAMSGLAAELVLVHADRGGSFWGKISTSLARERLFQSIDPLSGDLVRSRRMAMLLIERLSDSGFGADQDVTRHLSRHAGFALNVRASFPLRGFGAGTTTSLFLQAAIAYAEVNRDTVRAIASSLHSRKRLNRDELLRLSVGHVSPNN